MEKGETKSVPKQPTSTGAAVRDALLYDKRCVGCSYNLRGLPSQGVCPECGVPIAHSLWGTSIAELPPALIARLVRGSTLICIAWVFHVAVGVMVYFCSRSGWIGGMDALAMCILLILSVDAFVDVWGWWWLTTEMPNEDPVSKAYSARRVARSVTAWRTSLVICLGVAMSVLFLVPNGKISEGIQTFLAIGFIALPITMIVAYQSQLIYVRFLAKQLSGKRTIWSARLLFDLFHLGGIGVIVGIVVLTLLTSQFGRGVMLAGMLILFIGMTAWSVVSFLLYVRLRSLLVQDLRLALKSAQHASPRDMSADSGDA